VVWRWGGGYVGWAALPPVRRGGGVSVAVDIEVGEPPFWAFSFCEERFLTEVNLRERIVPVTRNVTLVNVTKNVTKVEVVNGRVINRGVDVREIERVSGRRVPRFRVREVSDRRQAGVRGNEIAVYRPTLPPRRERPVRPAQAQAARARAEGARTAGAAVPAARRPSRFEPTPPRSLTPSQVEAQRRESERYHARLAAEMAERHRRELQNVPAGPARERLLAEQERERRAFAVQRRRELAAWEARPVTIRRHPVRREGEQERRG
jgi:hypothetical protein